MASLVRLPRTSRVAASGGMASSGLASGGLASGGPGRQRGALGYVLAWLLGIPIPVLIIVALLRGCS
ncbi:MAG: hypothetical protein ACRET2_04815 [Steroidobacteraceae bacterium]